MTFKERHPTCRISTGICDSLTFGTGKLDANGYWEFPYYAAARTWQELHPEDGSCWPFYKGEAEETK